MSALNIKLLFTFILFSLVACGGSDNEITNFQPTISPAQMSSALQAAQGKSVSELKTMAITFDAGQSLFIQHCASCHGADGAGKKGVPDLTNGVWSWGGSEQDIYTSIAQGRHGVMEAFSRVLGEVDQGQVVAYIQSLSDPSKRNTLAEYGEGLYKKHCVICHGEDGKGLIPGAPNLSDDYWQHGGSMMNIRLSIARGAQGQCPAHADILDETQLKLLTAYVINLQQQ